MDHDVAAEVRVEPEIIEEAEEPGGKQHPRSCSSSPVNVDHEHQQYQPYQQHQLGPAIATDYSVVWETTTTALLTVHRSTWICLKGFGEIELLKDLLKESNSSSSSSTSSVYIQGFRLKAGVRLPFESSPWNDGLVTLTDIEIESTFRLSSSLLQSQLVLLDDAKPTFEILHVADDDKIRPTIPFHSWTHVVRSIVGNHQELHKVSQLTQLSQPPKRKRPSSRNKKNHEDHHNHAGFVVVFCGGAAVGKSTCLRMCYNMLLDQCAQVAVLDGSPATNGLLQLHVGNRPAGLDPFVEPLQNGDRRCVVGHFFGHDSARWDPQLYLQCMSSLVDVYLSTYASTMPLLIDTDNWLVKGLGFETLKSFVFDILGQPDHVVQILGDTASKTFDLNGTGPDPQQLVAIHSVPACDVENGSRPAMISQRNANSVRLVCSVLPEVRSLIRKEGNVIVDQQGFDDPSCSIAGAFASERPLVASLDDITIYPEGIPLAALNGAIVGLCEQGNAQQVALYGPALLNCVGIGVVRAVDIAKRHLFLLTATADPPAVIVVATEIRLPLECSFQGIRSQSFAGQSFDGSNVLGSDPMATRSVARPGLVNAKKNRSS
jgi:mRNA cleavage and polyadenylation factor CLP1 P-loop